MHCIAFVSYRIFTGGTLYFCLCMHHALTIVHCRVGAGSIFRFRLGTVRREHPLKTHFYGASRTDDALFGVAPLTHVMPVIVRFLDHASCTSMIPLDPTRLENPNVGIHS